VLYLWSALRANLQTLPKQLEVSSRKVSWRISALVRLALLMLLAVTSGVASRSTVQPAASSTPAIQITPNSGPYGTVTVVTGRVRSARAGGHLQTDAPILRL
jgi:hypothetical protein